MKWAIALTVTLLVASSGAALAQQPSQTASLADVARAEEARRKTTKKATKMLTNASLTAADESTAGTPATPAGSAATPGGRPAVPDDDEGEPTQAGPKKDQAYWSKRISQARSELARSQMFAESMQTRLNVLTADLVNLGYPARGVVEKQRDKTLAELDRVKKEIEQKTKEIAAIEDEARRANVPVGWLRPSV